MATKPRPLTPQQKNKLALEMAHKYLKMGPAGSAACLPRVKQENRPLYDLIIIHLEKIGPKK